MEASDDAVLEVNQAFYDAFEARSMERMDAVWEHSERVSCTHPGWRTLIGWASVRASWAALLDNEEHLQFILTDARAVIGADLAYVTGYENLLTGRGPQGSVAVVNVFARQADGTWRMVTHHGSPVLRGA